ncbi:MAG TPA: PH domain-containing protein [Candidatus Acidoferrales bacterium]|nr:PH domain-containing protein [Candidatus Acidoferrales bacterium]
MSYVKKNLVAGESLVYETGVHWSVLCGPVVTALLIGAGAILCFLQKDPNFLYVGAALVVVAAAVVAVAMVKRNATEIAVTNRRVIIKTGLAHRRSIEIMLPKVESIGITEPFLGRVLGYGTVVVRGTGGTPEPFNKIARPVEFRKHVHEQADQSRT